MINVVLTSVTDLEERALAESQWLVHEAPNKWIIFWWENSFELKLYFSKSVMKSDLTCCVRCCGSCLFSPRVVLFCELLRKDVSHGNLQGFFAHFVVDIFLSVRFFRENRLEILRLWLYESMLPLYLRGREGVTDWLQLSLGCLYLRTWRGCNYW